MFCSNCGYQGDSFRFCPKCGTKAPEQSDDNAGNCIDVYQNITSISKNKRVIAIIAGIVAAALVICIATVCFSGPMENKPQGTYVWTDAGINCAVYELKGNKVEYEMLGNSNKGTFKMVENTVVITYEDGGRDEFVYDAEKDELSLADVILLTKKK